MNKTCLLIPALLLLFCSRSDNDIAGTMSETDTGCAIVGLVQYVDSSAVVGADVILHDQALVRRMILGKQQAQCLIRTGITTTNINGFFRFDSVDTGGFLVEINDHDTRGAVVPVSIAPEDTLVQANGVLRRLGMIVGVVDTAKLPSGGAWSILLPEIGRTARIDSAGHFVLDRLPAWNYLIRVSAGDSLVALNSDTIRVPVTPSDTTRILSLGAETGTVIIDGTIIENPNDL